MRVARQVREHRLRASERPLGVDHPLALAHWREPSLERLGLGQRHVLAKELQLTCLMRPLQLFEEAPPEQPREHSHGQEEPRPAGQPTRAVGRESATGNDAMHMRVMRQRRTPGVQHQRGADARPEVLRVSGDGE